MSEAVKVRKQNRVVTVPKSRLAGYLRRGYDVIDEEGKVVQQATGGKVVSVTEYNKVVAELNELKANQVEGVVSQEEYDALKSELSDAKEDVKSYEAEIKRLEAENAKLKEQRQGAGQKRG